MVEENGKSKLTGVPSVSDEGSNPVHVAVKDDSNLSTVQAFDLEVDVLNYPPSITVNGQDQNSTTVTIDEDANESIWSAQAPDLNATDQETNALDWSISSFPVHGNVTITGTGNSPDSLVYIPEANFFGSDQFTVRVTDLGANGKPAKFDEITVNVTVQPVADDPSFLSMAITEITDEEDYVYNISTTDPDGNHTLTLSYNGTLARLVDRFSR